MCNDAAVEVIGYRTLLDNGNKVRLAPLVVIARDRALPLYRARRHK